MLVDGNFHIKMLTHYVSKKKNKYNTKISTQHTITISEPIGNGEAQSLAALGVVLMTCSRVPTLHA